MCNFNVKMSKIEKYEQNRKIYFVISDRYLGPIQVKSRLLSSSIFDAMNFQHFFGNARNYVTAFLKNAGNSLHHKC